MKQNICIASKYLPPMFVEKFFVYFCGLNPMSLICQTQPLVPSLYPHLIELLLMIIKFWMSFFWEELNSSSLQSDQTQRRSPIEQSLEREEIYSVIKWKTVEDVLGAQRPTRTSQCYVGFVSTVMRQSKDHRSALCFLSLVMRKHQRSRSEALHTIPDSYFKVKYNKDQGTATNWKSLRTQDR